MMKKIIFTDTGLPEKQAPLLQRDYSMFLRLKCQYKEHKHDIWPLFQANT